MRIEQLEHLMEISKTHSINLAAQNLHITQQSLSRSIKSLEDELSVLLFYRDHKGVSLTEQGQIVLKRAQEIIQTAQLMRQELCIQTEQTQNMTGTLNFIYMHGFDLRKLTTIINGFSTQYPETKFTISFQSVSVLLQSLLEEEKINIGLVLLPENFHLNSVLEKHQLEQLEIMPLYEENSMAAISKKSPLANNKSISISTLLKQPIVLLNNNDDIDNNWTKFLLQQFGIPNFSLVTSTEKIYVDAIINNIGVGFFTRSSSKNLTAEDLKNISVIPIRPSIKVFSSLVINRRHLNTPIIQAFLSFL